MGLELLGLCTGEFLLGTATLERQLFGRFVILDVVTYGLIRDK